MDESTLPNNISFEVIRYDNGTFLPKEVLVATEVPLTFMVNGEEFATLSCSPQNLEEYLYGFAFTSGIIHKASDIQNYYIDKKKWQISMKTTVPVDIKMLGKRVYTSGCGKGIIYSGIVEMSSRTPLDNKLKVSVFSIINGMNWLQKCSQSYKNTGCTHASALSIRGESPLVYIDDIGRHNAVDKVIGYALINKVDISNVLLLVTGRISSEILLKAKRAQIPCIISRGAPTHQTILQAREMGITTVGFARGEHFNIYSHCERIILKEQI